MADHPTIVVFPRGQLTAKDKERLTKAGVIAVEADSPHEVCQLQITVPMVSTKISGDAIVMSALRALCGPGANTSGLRNQLGVAQEEFLRSLAAVVKDSAHD